MDWEKYGYVIAGKLKQDIVLLLIEPKSPTELRKLLEKQDSAIARALTGLTKQKIIKQLNPEKRKGKVYALTIIGKQIQEKILMTKTRNGI